MLEFSLTTGELFTASAEMTSSVTSFPAKVRSSWEPFTGTVRSGIRGERRRSSPQAIPQAIRDAAEPILNHWKKVILEGARFSSIPRATILAVLPIIVMFPPKQAPKSNAHHRGKSLMVTASCSITGLKAATKITLSTKADPMAEEKRMKGTRVWISLPQT